MFCKNCGSEIEQGDLFCCFCGKPVSDTNDNKQNLHNNDYVQNAYSDSSAYYGVQDHSFHQPENDSTNIYINSSQKYNVQNRSEINPGYGNVQQNNQYSYVDNYNSTYYNPSQDYNNQYQNGYGDTYNSHSQYYYDQNQSDYNEMYAGEAQNYYNNYGNSNPSSQNKADKQSRKKKNKILISILAVLMVLLLGFLGTVRIFFWGMLFPESEIKISMSIPRKSLIPMTDIKNYSTNLFMLTSSGAKELKDTGAKEADSHPTDNGNFLVVSDSEDSDDPVILYVYDINGKEKYRTKNAIDEDYLFSGSGTTLLIRNYVTRQISIVDVNSGREKEIDCEGDIDTSIVSMSYDGNTTAVIHSGKLHIYKNGKETLTFSDNCRPYISGDGSYIYIACPETVNDSSCESISQGMWVYHDNKKTQINSKNAYSVLVMSKEGNEAIFSGNNVKYYYKYGSSDMIPIASESGDLCSPEYKINRSGTVKNMTYTSGEIMNNFICSKSGDNIGFFKAEDGKCTIEDLGRVASNSLSDDLSTVWTILDQKVNCCTVTEGQLNVLSYDTGSSNIYRISADRRGENACFIVDDRAYTITPSTMDSPVKILENANSSLYDKDGRLFISCKSGDVYQSDKGSQPEKAGSNISTLRATSEGVFAIRDDLMLLKFSGRKFEKFHDYYAIKDYATLKPIW